MIDNSITHDQKADPRRNWTQMRDRMREVIHAELDKILVPLDVCEDNRDYVDEQGNVTLRLEGE